MIVFLLLMFSSFIALSFYNFYYKRRKFPPGPTPLPIFGNLLSIHLSGAGELAFKKWAHEFGPIYTYWIGELPVICVADYELMMQLFQKDAENYASRYNFPILRVINDGQAAFGILISNGERWRQHRRFALRVLRDFGLGKNLLQERILDELRAMFAKIDLIIGQSDEEINLAEFVELSVASIINQLLFGFKFDGENVADFYEIKHLMDEHSEEVGGLKFEGRIANFYRYFEKRILDRKAKMERPTDFDTAPSSDYVQAFLREKARNDGTEGHQFESTYQLGMMCFDLWVTGQETVVSVLSWGIALLLNNEGPLAKMCEEIDQLLISDATVTDGRRMITVADKAQLPYTRAVTNEILRCANIAPQNFLRTVGSDVELANGFLLREGTCIVPQISVILCDERVFPEPERFNPDRFLDEDGKLRRCDELIPFSIGKRQCIGESMARMELFLFVANIFRQYKVSAGKIRPALKRIPSAVAHCSPFTCRIEKRISH
uniref:CYtochrome P450 family n=1 Tax=Globodera pallida TaxID=36090 RepID=A0A183BXY8_GLOPA